MSTMVRTTDVPASLLDELGGHLSEELLGRHFRKLSLLEVLLELYSNVSKISGRCRESGEENALSH